MRAAVARSCSLRPAEVISSSGQSLSDARRRWFLAALILFASAPSQAQVNLPAAEKAAVFRAAGYKLEGGQWRGCGDPGTTSYTPGQINEVRDLDGDGRPEATVTEGSTFCYGSTEAGYAIVSKQVDGKWKLITGGPGILKILPTKGSRVGRTSRWVDPASAFRSSDGTARSTHSRGTSIRASPAAQRADAGVKQAPPLTTV